GLLVSRVYVRDVPVYEWFAIPALVALAVALGLRSISYFIDQTGAPGLKVRPTSISGERHTWRPPYVHQSQAGSSDPAHGFFNANPPCHSTHHFATARMDGRGARLTATDVR